MFEVKETRDKAMPSVRLTPEERRAVEAEARKRGLSLSDLAREALRHYLQQGGGQWQAKV